MRRIIIMGASGSIGTQSIEIIRQHQDELKIVGVTVGKNIKCLESLLEEFKDIKYAYSIFKQEELESKYPNVKFFYGDDGLCQMAALNDYDILENALVGFYGFKPTLVAINNHKDIALANKETLVAGGELINEAIEKTGINLYPIDSEHVALLQCMQGHNKDEIRRFIITGSGGAFRDLNRQELINVTPLDALKHPSWNMGAKITIDCATMMNKGFEVIEAHYLFNMPFEKIDVILHKQSTVHSFVEYVDGSIMAQIGCTDMRLMIKYALLYPHHKNDSCTKYLDLDTLTSLDFKKMDYDRYPLVALAKKVGQRKGNLGAILVGANDEAVSLFLNGKISFLDIEKMIVKTIESSEFIEKPSADQIINSHQWAKDYVNKLLANS